MAKVGEIRIVNSPANEVLKEWAGQLVATLDKEADGGVIMADNFLDYYPENLEMPPGMSVMKPKFAAERIIAETTADGFEVELIKTDKRYWKWAEAPDDGPSEDVTY